MPSGDTGQFFAQVIKTDIGKHHVLPDEMPKTAAPWVMQYSDCGYRTETTEKPPKSNVPLG